jgi:hypothetical protein
VAATAADDPEPLMDTRFAPGRPPMRPGEEIAHGLREIPQRLLLQENTTDIPRRERRFLPGLKAGVSTPRKR